MSDEINDPLALLRVELAAVEPSPEFAARVRVRLNDEPNSEKDELESLRAELGELAPSPEFAVRVRQSIEDGRRSRFSWLMWNWRWVVPVSGLAAAAALAVVFLRPADTHAPVTATANLPTTSSTAQPAGTPLIQPGPAEVRTVARAGRPSPAQRSTKPHDPMLEVITDQPALLRNLAVRVGAGVAVDSTEPAGMYQAPKIEVAPIEVSPIAVFVVPDSRSSIGVLPFILRVAADSAGRSSR